MEFLWRLKVKSINQLWINQQVYLHGFQICCHSTWPIKETWISVRTLHNRSLISTNKIDPSKKASHRSLTRQWVHPRCGWTDVVDWTPIFLNGLWSAHQRDRGFAFRPDTSKTCACKWKEDIWQERGLKQIFVSLLVGFAQQ